MQTSGSTNTWMRLAPWAGIAFAILFTAGFFIHGLPLPANDEIEEWQSHWDDSGNRVEAICAMYLMIAGLLAFLWFSRSLLVRMADRTGDSQPLASIAQAASTIFVAVALVSVVVGATIAGAVEFGDANVPESADLPIHLDQLAIGLLLIPGGLSFAVFIAVIAELARRSTALPKWLVWASFIAAILLLLSPLFIPLILVPLWSLVTGIVLLLRDRKGTAPAAAPATA